MSQSLNFTDHYIQLCKPYKEPLLLAGSNIPYLYFNTINYIVEAVEVPPNNMGALTGCFVSLP